MKHWAAILLLLVPALIAPSARAQDPAATKPAEQAAGTEPYQTLYLTNVSQQSDAADVLTAMRNSLPRAKIYYVASQNAISIRAAAEDIQLAQKILADLDRSKKVYRLTFTIDESDGGKRTGSQQVALIVIPGGKSVLKQGSRVPIVTGTVENGTPHSQVQYIDLGLTIEASLEGTADGLRLRAKVEQSKAAEEKSGLGAQDPVILQTMLDGVTTLAQGKLLVLGSLDMPGSTRRQEIEVMSEVVQ
jgi:type II secretory pathway component GspD/PulD (secretin)